MPLTSKRRIILLSLVAVALGSYLLQLFLGLWLVVALLVLGCFVVACIAFTRHIIIHRRLSMRSLIFFIPLVMALIFLPAREIARSRWHQSKLAKLQARADFDYSGLYGALNRELGRLGTPFHQTFPTDIRELEIDPSCQEVAELKELPLQRLKDVRLSRWSFPTQPMSEDMLDWLNGLSADVKIGVFSGCATKRRRTDNASTQTSARSFGTRRR